MARGRGGWRASFVPIGRVDISPRALPHRVSEVVVAGRSESLLHFGKIGRGGRCRGGEFGNSRRRSLCCYFARSLRVCSMCVQCAGACARSKRKKKKACTVHLCRRELYCVKQRKHMGRIFFDAFSAAPVVLHCAQRRPIFEDARRRCS